jgi:hypothetical protein
MVGTTHANCRLHRHWVFDRLYAFGGGEGITTNPMTVT